MRPSNTIIIEEMSCPVQNAWAVALGTPWYMWYEGKCLYMHVVAKNDSED